MNNLLLHVEDKIAPPELITYCQFLAKRIMQNNYTALSLAKQSINIGLNSDLDSGLKLESSLFGLSFATDEHCQGLKSFLERHKAKNIWKDN